MNNPYKTRAIVIKVRDLSEKDRIVTFISPERGIFDAVAKGVKKLTASTMGKMEPINYVSLMVRPGKSLDAVDQVELLSGFPSIRSCLERAGAAIYILDLINRQLEKGHENRELFVLLKKIFILMEKGLNPELACRYFEARFMDISGYRPVTDRCIGCGKKGSFEFFSISGGGTVCGECEKTGSLKNLKKITPGTVSALGHLLKTSPELICRLSLGDKSKEELKTLLEAFMEYNLPGKTPDRDQYSKLQE